MGSKPDRLAYVVGIPGSGKTTLMAEVVKGWTAYQHAKPFAHISYDDAPEAIVQLGKDRGTFSGTDALSMAVQPKVLEWLPTCGYSTVLAEGDRLANDAFFREWIRISGNGPIIFALKIDAREAWRRREGRGSNQDPTWLRGRVTKVQNLLDHWPHIVIDANAPTEDNAAKVRAILWPE